MAALTNNTVASTYQSLLKTIDNGIVSSSLKTITDGFGNPTAISLDDHEVVIAGDLTVTGTVNTTYLNVLIESASIIFSSGSNILGDSTADTQTLIGTVIVSGSQQITGSLDVSAGVKGLFFRNETSPTFTNIITAKENILNHGDLVVNATDTFIVEEDAQYFILGELINSGSVVVSGSLIVNRGIRGNGSITGPGTVLNNTTIVTYDKANKSYGFPQLDGDGMISSSQYLEPFSKNTTTTVSPNVIRPYQNIFNHDNLQVQAGVIFVVEKNAEYYMLGDLTNNGTVIVSGSLAVDGAINLYGPLILASGSGIIL